tara:strand:+ start:426 stop:1421 length:996 start_codon:yes stop_codon:yes gene_type:complete
MILLNKYNNIMNILITGGAGFIGLHLAKFHLELGDSVYIIDNLFKTNKDNDLEFENMKKNPNFHFISIDLSKKVSNIDIPKDLEIVYHLAAINGTRLFYEIPYEVSRINLLSTINLLDWLETQSVKRIIYSSTSEVYAGAYDYGLVDFPTNENVPVIFKQPTHDRFSYATSKFMGEILFINFGKKFNKEISVLRYHNIYGPRMGSKHVIPELILRINQSENPLKLFGFSETRSFCYISDAIDATYRIAKCTESIGEIIHIGNSFEEIKIYDLADKIISIMGANIRIDESPSLEASVNRRCPDISKLQLLTDFSPKVDLQKGLEDTISWYLN